MNVTSHLPALRLSTRFGTHPKSAGTRTLYRSLCLLAVLVAAVPATAFADASDEISVPDGFRVSLFADDDLAHDVYCMTTDSQGRIVVSGPGYVRILIDTDGDGKADEAKTFADGPESGAQGMFFLGRDLFCIGDAGLLRYRDADGDDRADGPPQAFLKLKTGEEHHVHSIQKGPDGWWYLIAGNFAGIDSKYVTLPTSPVKQPQAGTLFRLKPDLSGGEVVAHGFRNAYDFAFNSLGDAFTFDSEGEREVSLPWYQPTRVYHVVPGGHAGWVSRSWKQPSDFTDMPPVLAEFGRGSPTGVVCYRHNAFPVEYRDSLFVLDWTYGRVLNVKLKRDGASYAPTPSVFMRQKGQFGFAPTDATIGKDGSVFVSIGGRGTRGGVYQVTATTGDRPDWPGEASTLVQQAVACVTAPEPLSSWSREVWLPLSKSAGRGEFVKVAVNPKSPTSQRVRAIEILVSEFGGLLADEVTALQQDEVPEIRARAIWAVGRTSLPGEKLAAQFLADSDPYVGRVASESLLGQPGELSDPALIKSLVERLNSADRFDRMAAARLVPQLDDKAFRQLATAAAKAGWQATVANAFGYLGRNPGYSQHAFRAALPVLERDFPVELKLEAVRLMQMGLGDLAPVGRVKPVFEGYAPAIDLTEVERELDLHRIRLAELFPTGNDRLDFELARLLAMLEPFNAELLTRVLAKITTESHPTADLHYLIVAARLPASRDKAHREKTASAFVAIERKMKERKLNQDSNWEPRLKELYKTLIDHDPLLPDAIVAEAGFGLPGHVLFMSHIPGELLDTAIDAFAKQVAVDKAYPWSNDVVFVFGESQKPEHRELIRSLYDEHFNVRGAVQVVLSGKPEETDRSKFLDGLDSSQLEILTACLDALEKLPPAKDESQIVALTRCLRRLGSDKSEFPARQRVVSLLRAATGQSFGFVDGPSGFNRQQDAVDRWSNWVSGTFPNAAAEIEGASSQDLAALKSLLADVDWSAGDTARGRMLFEKRACIQCHGGRTALGPDLDGIAGRFSREDLFTAIVLPNKDVSSRYRTTMLELENGKVYSGLIIYESVDGVLLRNSTNQTFRIETRDVALRRQLPTSLMPAGLLKGLKPEDLADLYEYLNSLRR
ncbi:MAG: c-type cytochrome [Planctomycetota bacterium]|nr:c-type cytochrome [Planctomycetota bacterium]MDA1248545.1 c-type cytochrome [Planctomycetota bacterium]